MLKKHIQLLKVRAGTKNYIRNKLHYFFTKYDLGMPYSAFSSSVNRLKQYDAAVKKKESRKQLRHRGGMPNIEDPPVEIAGPTVTLPRREMLWN